MKKLEDLLQERLEQLESGEPLEACLAGLPEGEADLLKLAVGLRKVQYPARDSGVVAAQRAELIGLAKEKNMESRSSQEAEQVSLRSLLDWLRPRTVLSGAVALLAICALVVAVGAGMGWWSSGETEVAEGPPSSPTSETGLAQNLVPEPTSKSEHGIFLPFVSGPEVRNPQTAALKDVQGVVQVQGSDGSWTAASAGRRITAGQRIRTGGLSSARLVFYDGSQAYLGPDTEVSVDELDARLADGPRVVALTQWIGETDHDVAPASGANSRYEIRTPSATGAARGTSFHVLVTPDLLTHFSVDEGSVAVTGQEVTVVVVAGQLTTVDDGQAPSEPVFRITGEGEVTQTGTTWVIAGQTFETHDGTVIVGDPQVGDWVFVEGRLLADNTRIADRIVLLRRAPENRFTITGRVDALGDTAWTVAGQTIDVDDETDVEEDIEVGDLVRVEGVITQGGTLLAEQIQSIEDEPGLPFSFVGVVQSIADEAWTISGVEIAVDADTEIDEGLVSGDIVEVQGWILDDESWLASSIKRVEDEEREFEITGDVESIAPWVVAGIAFETREWTEIEAGIEIGDRVRVKGRILEDGTWVATEIERLDEDDQVLRFVFVGTVDGIDPWVVSGIPLAVDDETIIEGDVGVGDLVKVEVGILPDGTWQVIKITLISEDEPGLGCLYITAVVTGVNADQIELLNWPTITLDDGVPVEGEITVGSVLLLLVCVDADGAIHVVSVVVIYQPEPVVPPPPPSPPPPPPPPGYDEDAKVTICHKAGKNAHTITISRSALQSHLNHGDTIGPCP